MESKMNKLTEVRNRNVVTRIWGEREMGEVMVKGYKVLVMQDK